MRKREALNKNVQRLVSKRKKETSADKGIEVKYYKQQSKKKRMLTLVTSENKVTEACWK